MSVTRVSPPGDGQNARLSKWEGYIASLLPTPPPPQPRCTAPQCLPRLPLLGTASRQHNGFPFPACLSEEPLAWNVASETAILGSGIG